MTQHDFGQPIVDEVAPSAHVDASSNGTPSEQTQEILDINDPRLTSEVLEANLEADAYVMPPPPPDARYRAKLKLVQQEHPTTKEKVDYMAAIWGKDKQMVAVAQVEASIIDPHGQQDGVKVYDRNVSTFLGRGGATKVSTILARLRQPSGEPWVKPGQKLTSGEWMKILVKALAGEPEIGLETVWEWSCQKCGEEAKAKKESYPRSITGMHNFPVVGGKRSSEMLCQAGKGHGPSRARATISRFLHLSELK